MRKPEAHSSLGTTAIDEKRIKDMGIVVVPPLPYGCCILWE